MRSSTSLIIGLSLVSIFLFFVLVTTLCLFWRKKRINADIDENCSIPIKKLQYPFCWTWKSPSLMAIHQQESSTPVDLAAQSGQLHLNPSKDTIEAELLRLYSLAGPPRLLFTIKEETKEDLESEDGRSPGRRSSKYCGGKTLNDLFNSSDRTPLSTSPSWSPCTRNGFNFNREDDFARMWSSPSPKFKFLKHAELKFYRKLLIKEAGKADTNAEMANNLEKQNMGCEQEGDGSNFIGIVIGKIRDGEKHQHSSSSQKEEEVKMSFSSFPVHLDPPNWNLQLPDAIGAGAGGGEAGLASAQAPGVAAAQPTISTAERAQLGKVPPPEQALRCPRCDSTNTKFCYFNNYSFSQPRHFCKACRRYWTRGGSLRSVPVGGACRRRRNSSAKSSSTSSEPSNLAPSSGVILTINAAAAAAAAAAGRQIEQWNLPQMPRLPFSEPAAQRPPKLTLPRFQIPPVKMEDHASHLGFILPRQYSAPPGNYRQHYWSSSNGIKDGGGGSSNGIKGGGWATTADLYVFESSSIPFPGYNNNSS